MSNLLRPKRAAAKLDVGETFFWGLVKQRRIRLVHLSPKVVAAIEDEIDELIETLRRERDAAEAAKSENAT
jgi:predicted DNA-binding transcriptional regulator AlpA